MYRVVFHLFLGFSILQLTDYAAAGTYTFEKFSVPGATDVNVTGIDMYGKASGFATFSGGAQLSFIRDTDGVFEYFQASTNEMTYALGVNEAGVIVGDTYDGIGGRRGFVRAIDGTITLFDVPAAHGFQVNDINGLGQIVGLRAHMSGSEVIFIRQPTGEIQDFDIPNSAYDGAFGINDHGIVSGNVDLSASGFLLNLADGSTSLIQVPGSSNTTLFGINDYGTSVGQWYSTEAGLHSFVRHSTGSIEELVVPESSGTYSWAINNRGQMAGRYVDPTNGGSYGFIATPVPEPGTIVLFGAAFVMLPVVRVWRATARLDGTK